MAGSAQTPAAAPTVPTDFALRSKKTEAANIIYEKYFAFSKNVAYDALIDPAPGLLPLLESGVHA